MKRSILLVLPLLLAACSSAPVSNTVQAPDDKAPLLTVVGSAPLGNDYTQALQIAKADASASVVKFLATQVRSKSGASSRTEDNVTVYDAFNQTTENAAGLVRGLVFDEEVIDGDRLVVHGMITFDSVGRAKRLQALMR